MCSCEQAFRRLLLHLMKYAQLMCPWERVFPRYACTSGYCTLIVKCTINNSSHVHEILNITYLAWSWIWIGWRLILMFSVAFLGFFICVIVITRVHPLFPCN